MFKVYVSWLFSLIIAVIAPAQGTSTVDVDPNSFIMIDNNIVNHQDIRYFTPVSQIIVNYPQVTGVINLGTLNSSYINQNNLPDGKVTGVIIETNQNYDPLGNNFSGRLLFSITDSRNTFITSPNLRNNRFIGLLRATFIYNVNASVPSSPQIFSIQLVNEHSEITSSSPFGNYCSGTITLTYSFDNWNSSKTVIKSNLNRSYNSIIGGLNEIIVNPTYAGQEIRLDVELYIDATITREVGAPSFGETYRGLGAKFFILPDYQSPILSYIDTSACTTLEVMRGGVNSFGLRDVEFIYKPPFTDVLNHTSWQLLPYLLVSFSRYNTPLPLPFCPQYLDPNSSSVIPYYSIDSEGIAKYIVTLPVIIPSLTMFIQGYTLNPNNLNRPPLVSEVIVVK